MIIAKIHNKYKDLTKTEQRIASYILSNPDEVSHITASELAQRCDTVQSAVIRFCKSVELDGFTELKILLAQEIGGRPSSEELPAFSPSDDTETVFKKVFQSGIHTLQDTLEMINYDKIKNITELLLKAEHIYIFGIGTSSVIAIDAAYRLSQLGLPAVSCTDILFMNVTAVNMKPGDVAIGISHSGRTKGVVDAVRHAKNAGACTVAITSYSDSILYNESDFAVSVYADEENYPVEAVSARMAQMCLIDALMMTLVTMNYDSVAKHIAVRNMVLGDIRYKL